MVVAGAARLSLWKPAPEGGCRPRRRLLTGLARDLFGRRYLPGFVGLNNLNNLNQTDYMNVVVQALSHVRPVRDFFLSYPGPNAPPSVHTYTNKKGKTKTKVVNHHEFLHLAQCFGELVRKMWSNKRFKATVDPHMLVQAVSVASTKKYHIGKQVDVAEFLAWFLHQLHVGVGGTKKAGSSIVHETFQGVVEVTTVQRRRKRRKGRK
jgi:U4/U6.U5 tri-snRNP-associated protein 2